MLNEPTEDELISRLRSGDQQALEALHTRHRRRLKQMLDLRMDRRLRGRVDASDILQEVFLDARLRISHFVEQEKLSFFVWLRKLTKQRMIDVHRQHLKTQMRDIKQEISIDHGAAAASSASMARLLVDRIATPSQLAMKAEGIRQIERALDRLDPIDREILTLRHLEELRNSEVAQILGLKEAAASNRYIRALSRLREMVADLSGLKNNT